MKIRLLSDLHFEFGDYIKYDIQYNNEDVLVLAGDLASGAQEVARALRYFRDLGFPQIIYVPGNHEYYGCTIDEFNRLLAAQILDDNIHLFLDGGHVVSINDVTFMGAPLWTNFGNDQYAIDAANSMISDFRFIRNFSPVNAVRLYDKHLANIKYWYEYTKGKKVIITHFLPAQECISERFKGDNLLNKYFANALDEWIAELSDTTWLHGHTHDSVDFVLGTTRIVCNPYGYQSYETNQQFNKDKVIEL